MLADQWTKSAAWALFEREGNYIEIFFWLNFIKAQNTGMAWSLLEDHPQFLLWITSIISLVLIVVALKSSPNAKVLFSWALIVGGAVGNILDRLQTFGPRQLVVRDFIDVHWQDWHWATFNLADSFICLGAAYLFLYSFVEDAQAK